MNVLHISDTHGTFPELLNGASVVVHSGDLLPNFRPVDRAAEARHQIAWAYRHSSRVVEWLNGRTLLLCAGNHDFAPMSEVASLWRRAGADVHSITWCVREVDGVRFYGLPSVPWFGGYWNHECDGTQLHDDTRKVVDLINAGEVDVLVAHCPPYGVLDQTLRWERIGNQSLAHSLAYGFTRKPSAILCGHVHEACGARVECGVLVSNAATTQRLVEVFRVDDVAAA